MWDFSLLIEQDISDKKLMAFSEFVIFAVNWAIYHSYQQVFKFLFLIRTFVKENSNLMCGSF